MHFLRVSFSIIIVEFISTDKLKKSAQAYLIRYREFIMN